MEETYIKQFDKWGEYEKNLDKRGAPLRFYARDIWWCAIGVNIGSEIDGKNDDFERPVLILKRIRKDLILIVPITSTIKDYPYRITCNILNIESQILIEHIRVISTKRLLRKISIAKLLIFIQTILSSVRLLSTINTKSETPQ